MSVFLGVDIGTSSTKGVLVHSDGTIIRQAIRHHRPTRPHPGHVEMAMELWWQEFISLALELGDGHSVSAVGVSGMGPCVGLADHAGIPTRPAILYGVDTRSTPQVDRLTDELGADALLARCGSVLSSQAAGPKIQWVAENEPEVFSRSARFFMPASWLAWNLTGAYVLDHQSASQCTPLYDIESHEWFDSWTLPITRHLELPHLVWADSVIGEVTKDAAIATGLPAGIPVIAGTIDAWTEAVSVNGHGIGDLMLMYGTTMFLINTVPRPVRVPTLWGTVGVFPGTHCLAGGMATSGAVVEWIREVTSGGDHESLMREARSSGHGARGLLMLPYFAGERTPISDPDARGVIIGLTTEHSPADLYRAGLEATAFGVRHNIDTMRAAGGDIRRLVAVGGGTQGDLWMQIVSDVTGLRQDVPAVTIGASFGAAYLAARAVTSVGIDEWNPVLRTVEPDSSTRDLYDQRFALYRELYSATAPIAHALAQSSRREPEN
jgi:xylulokinase